MKKFKAIDLFAGIGGIKLGLLRAGFSVVYSNDIDPYCKFTFEANFPEKLDSRDIATVPLEDIPEHDLLAAGFPCQPFSMAGHQKGFEDTRGSMFFHLVNIIKNKRPKAFLLENVKNLKNHNKGETFKVILRMLEEIGYKVHYKVLNSKNFGLPQNRERIYIVGFKQSTSFKFPEPFSTKQPKMEDILENKQVDESYFLSQRYYEGLANHKARHRARGSGFGFEILDREGISFALVVGNMGRERNLIKDSIREGFYTEGMDKAIARNCLGVRRLTIHECSRLQGFPEGFTFPVSRTQAYKQLGNTVSVPVIEAVAKAIEDALSAKDTNQVEENIETSNYLTYKTNAIVINPI